ncbi:hypothetical protein [Pseudomonas nitroreducens]|uniref:hypothetical protein n=1 Tax=Pseudomonas nitroreducens TaxID=46680 RepID=UPI0026596D11|nr:hypothetical protein [Pseudomonas nitroreducens]MCP1652699.1 hypothetical protein [Pseudomonas nitroreducens]
MTRNAKQDGEKKSPEAIRQERHRQALEEAGLKEVATYLGAAEREALMEGCKVRGGVDGPYTVAEYLAALIRQDSERLMEQLAEAQKYPCRQCGKALPKGCGGAFKGELSCLHTPTAWKLRIPTQIEA